VGLDKMGYMESIFSDASLNAMCELRSVFDPERRANPGKVVPIHSCREWNAAASARVPAPLSALPSHPVAG
jgi:glycolate oxidase